MFGIVYHKIDLGGFKDKDIVAQIEYLALMT